MQVIESPEAQGSFELGTILGVRRFPDNNVMLGWLHSNGKLKKVDTKDVIVTAAPQSTIQLNELNQLIAEQKGVSLEDLSIGGSSKTESQEIATVSELPVEKSSDETTAKPAVTEVLDDTALAKNLRSQADAMFKEAQTLRKQADELDPPKKKASTAKSKKEMA